MQKEWSSFRITLLLYILVLILPVSFYLVYASFKTIQNDTSIVSQTSRFGGAITTLSVDPKSPTLKQTISHADADLQDISTWVKQNERSELYIGADSLASDFAQVAACWNSYKTGLSTQDSDRVREQALECREKADTLAIVIEKMVYLKQSKMINLFYFALAVAMLLTLLIIYMVRLYIHQQMRKHTIYDHETRLFNKKYFMAELKTTCSRSARHDYPLSLLTVSINEFEKGNNAFTKGVQRNTLKAFGTLIRSVMRDSDIACRYDENTFLILLPFTEAESALHLKERIQHVLEKDNWMVSNKISFDFGTTEFDKKESEEAFLQRSLEL
ncbi:MAG TPA: diguanylate cyclase [Sulfurovum sp.]|uniref:GGDEF domain-containing protein n=1 Tax=Sulfurovum sp. TaxID=1969726 RepID=UPI002F93EC15